jgi:hypothetical protein
VTIRILAAALLLLACSPAERRDQETSAPPSPAGARAAPATVTPADFQALRWIEGTWRGSGGGVDAFYERYELVDDSTLRRYSFADSTLGAVSDSARIGLRGNHVLDPIHAPEWQVTSFDSTSWRFESIGHAGRAFTWRRETADSWTAILESRDAGGNPQQHVYTLVRLAE